MAKRSGYARDIMPHLMEAEEKAGLAVPIATGKGMQEGIIPPAERMYKAKYGSVDISTAMANMTKRMNGEMAEIKGGITDPEAFMAGKTVKKAANTGIVVSVPQRKAAPAKSKAVGKDKYDPVGGEVIEDPQPGDLEAEERRLTTQEAPRYVQTAIEPAVPQTYVIPTPEQEYLSKRSRVTLEMPDGTMSMACIDLIESQYSMTILLPLDPNGATFIPKPGSEITIVAMGARMPCYFPGATFEIPELKLLGLVFIKAESK